MVINFTAEIKPATFLTNATYDARLLWHKRVWIRM